MRIRARYGRWFVSRVTRCGQDRKIQIKFAPRERSTHSAACLCITSTWCRKGWTARLCSLFGSWYEYMRVTCTFSKVDNFRNHWMPLARTQTMTCAYTLSVSQPPTWPTSTILTLQVPRRSVGTHHGGYVDLGDSRSCESEKYVCKLSVTNIYTELKQIIETLSVACAPTVRTLEAYQVLR